MRRKGEISFFSFFWGALRYFAYLRCEGKEQAIRYACILLDISDESQEPFDELLIEQSAKSIWVHFAVRPSENRRKVDFIKR